MRIQVMYHDGSTEMVRPQLLRCLIETDEIARFQRSDGWVIPGVDRLRNQPQTYDGKERRRHLHSY